MDVLTGFAILLACQLAGEVLVVALGVPVPGPVVGMALLFLTLSLRRKVGQPLESAAGSLLGHLSLLFVPAGVGVIVHLDRIGDEWLPILAALVLGTLTTLVVTALTMRLGMRLMSRGGERRGGD